MHRLLLLWYFYEFWSRTSLRCGVPTRAKKAQFWGRKLVITTKLSIVCTTLCHMRHITYELGAHMPQTCDTCMSHLVFTLSKLYCDTCQIFFLISKFQTQPDTLFSRTWYEAPGTLSWVVPSLACHTSLCQLCHASVSVHMPY